jgi:hypothetical protein
MAKRILISLLSAAGGWLVGLLVYLSLANPSGRDLTFWCIATAVVSTVGWLLVGVPFAIWNPTLNSASRVLLAIVGTGVAGMLMISLLSQAIVSFFHLIAFVTAAASMTIYIVTSSLLRGDF